MNKNFRRSRWIYVYVSVLIIIFFCLVIPGLKNEHIPNNKIASVSFYSFTESSKKILIEKMDDFKQDHRKLVENNLYQDVIFQFLPPPDYLEEMEKEEDITIESQKLYVSKNKMRWLSNNLMSPSVWDEQVIFRMLYNFKPEKFDFNPRLFRYGGAWLYPMSFSLFISSKIGLIKLVKDTSYYMNHPQTVFLMSAIGKCFGIVCYAMVLVISFFFIPKYYDVRTFIIASLFMVFCPVIIVETVYLKPLLTSSMWYLLGMYFMFRLLFNIGNRKRNAIYVGCAGGLSAASLIVSASILLPIFLSITYNRFFPLKKLKEKLFKKPFNDVRLFAFSIIAFIAAFLVTHPYTVLSYKEFIKEILWNIQNYSHLSFWNPMIHLQNIFNFMRSSNWPFGLAFLLALIWTILNHHDKRNRIILFAILGYYLSAFHRFYAVKNLHALIPILPLMILLVANFFNNFLQKKALYKIISSCLIIIIILYSCMNSFYYTLSLQTKPRTLAGEWINRNIPAGSSIGTYINMPGLAYNYPYFNYFLYPFLNDSSPNLSRIRKELPQYYIISRSYIPKTFEIFAVDKASKTYPGDQVESIEKEEERVTSSYYEKVAEFDSKLGLLSKIFKNKLMVWWTKEIIIYEKK